MPVGFFSLSPIKLTFIFYFLFPAFYSFVFHRHHYITKKYKFSYLVFFLFSEKIRQNREKKGSFIYFGFRPGHVFLAFCLQAAP